ncbi:unnamed protein product [Penicillium pancosmium]
MELPAKLPFSKRRLRPRVIISACVIGFAILDSLEPYHQHFALQNYTLQYPYAVHERIPIAYALCISGAFPLVLIIVYTLFIDGIFSHKKQDPVSGKRKLRGPWRWKDRLWEMNCGILGLLLSQGVTFVITQALKTACGKPRPDLIDRCQPRAGSVDPQMYGLSNSSICTGDPKIIKDGFRSWPSASFAGLFYIALWLGGKLHIMDNRGEAWKTLLCMTPILAATLVAVSRIMDARHHPFDVITGSMLGTLVAFVAYRQYFPPITESWRKGRAYPIRTWGTEPVHPNDPLGVKLLSSQEALHNPEAERLSPANENLNAGSPLNPNQNPNLVAAAPPPASYSNHGNPFVAGPYQRRRRHDHDPDGNWSSSEEDVVDGYEMQHGYDMSQQNVNRFYPPQYEGGAGGTAYQSQAQGVPVGAGAGVGMATSTPAGVHHGHGRPLTDTPIRDV